MSDAEGCVDDAEGGMDDAEGGVDDAEDEAAIGEPVHLRSASAFTGYQTTLCELLCSCSSTRML